MIVLRHPARRFSTLLATIAVMGLIAVPAWSRDDVLIMKDGSRVHAPDGYEVDGRRVVYKNLHGVLTMVRTSLVDFEAMERHDAERNRLTAEREAQEAYFDRTVVDLSHTEQQESALGRRMSTGGAIIDYADLARQLGVGVDRFESLGDQASVASEACTRSLSRFLHLVWSIDLHRRSSIQASAETLTSLAQRTAERSQELDDALASQALRELSAAYRSLANEAAKDPASFARRVRPWTAPAG